ncbi:MAG: hypothetical protein OSB10_01540, partial [Planctomycetota bacterium]|nr:hypothetical protein [Planctomycetota bacterium]
LVVDLGTPIERVIGGEARSGKRFLLSPQDAVQDAVQQHAQELDVFGYVRGDDLIGIFARTESGTGENMRAAADQVLAALEVHQLDGNSTRLVPLGDFTLRVPALLAEGMNLTADGFFYQLATPEGVLEIGTQSFPDTDAADVVKTQFQVGRKDEIAAAIAVGGGEVVGTRWAGVWVRTGILEGMHLAVRAGDGSRHTSSNYFFTLRNQFFYVTFDTPDENHAALVQRMTDVLNTLEFTSDPSGLDASLGRVQLNQDLGVTLYYPSSLRLTDRLGYVPHLYSKDANRQAVAAAGENPRLVLENDMSFAGQDFKALFEVTPTELDSAGLTTWAMRTAEEFYPAAIFGDPWEIESQVFGIKHKGMGLPWTSNGVSYQINAIPSPSQDGGVVVAAICPSADANASLWIFANLLGGLAELPNGPRTISTVGVQLRFDPADWSANLSVTPIGAEYAFGRRDSSCSVRVATEAWSDINPQNATFDDLVQRAQVEFERRRASSGVELGHMSMEFLTVDSGKSSAVTLGTAAAQSSSGVASAGATAIKNELLIMLVTGERYRLTTHVLRTPNAQIVLRSRVNTTAEKGPAEAQAIEDLLDTLVLDQAISFDPQIPVIGNLKVHLPIGFSGDFSAEEFAESLTITNEFAPDQFVLIGAFPADLLANMDTIWESTQAGIRANAEDFTSTFAVTPVKVMFLGEKRQGKTFTYTDLDGTETGTVTKFFHASGSVGFEITVASTTADAADGGVEKIFDLLAQAESVPLWLHSSHDGYGLDFPYPDLRLVSLEDGELTPGVYALSNGETEETFFVDELGDWAMPDAPLAGIFLEVQNTQTNAKDLTATQDVELDCYSVKFKTRLSMKTDVQRANDAHFLSNLDKKEEFSASILVEPLTGAFGTSARLMTNSLFQNPNYAVRDFDLIQRVILGQRATGHRYLYDSPQLEPRVQELYSVQIAEGALELAFWYTPTQDGLGRTQVDLFLDNLRRIP